MIHSMRSMFSILLFFPLSILLPDVCRLDTPACERLNFLVKEGLATGNQGDYYDNRDDRHSMLNLSQHPEVSLVTYTEEEKRERLHYGPQVRILNKVVIGNSSTASADRSLGSNVRRAYYWYNTGLNFLYMQYRNNNLYIYPSANDFTEGSGDLLPTNTPYVLLSLGASGSDLPFLRAFFLTLAAFKRDVKEKLIDYGLLMPALQMILRRSLLTVHDEKDYLSGIANPSVFDSKWLDPEQMVRTANDMTIETIPPLALLKEEKTIQVLFQEGFQDDTTFIGDTPCAIARMLIDPLKPYKMEVTAKDSFDLLQRPLTMRWVLLRGDPERVSIKPSSDTLSATIEVSMQKRGPTPENSDVLSDRVDIGVFADNGITLSPPSFITFHMINRMRKSSFPPTELRLRSRMR